MPSKTGGRNYFQCGGDGWPDQSVRPEEEEAELQPVKIGTGSFALQRGQFDHNSSSFEEEQRITPMMSFAARVCEVTISSGGVVNLCGTVGQCLFIEAGKTEDCTKSWHKNDDVPDRWRYRAAV